MMKNERFLKTIRREPVDATPIWLMRQAGRYLPEYREARARAGSFMTLCKTPLLAAEVTLQPLYRYALDAGIIFSDILVIPDAMGLALEVAEGRGPYFKCPLEKPADIERLSVPDSANLEYVYEAIRIVKCDLGGRIPLIGFAGSPFTLAAYMIEGQSQPLFPKAQQLLKEDPKHMHHLLNLLAEATANHLNAQIAAGADAVMIFDTWGGLLDTATYLTFSLAYIQQCIAHIKSHAQHRTVPVILFTKGGHQWLLSMSQVGCDVISLDWTTSLQEARSRVGDRVALQGNLDPAHLMADEATIRREALRVLDSYGHGSGHVFNLGHGVTKTVPPEHVGILVDAVHELSRPYHTRRGAI